MSTNTDDIEVEYEEAEVVSANVDAAESAKSTKEPAPTKNVIMLSSDALKGIRGEAARKAVGKVNSQIASAGFKSLDELIAAAKKPVEKATEEAPTVTKVEAKPTKADADESTDALRRVTAEKRVAEQKLQQSNDEKAALKAEFDIRIAAMQAGVLDEDYALFSVKQHVAKLSDAELKTFDLSAYFKTLQEKKSHLFKVSAVNTESPGQSPKPAETAEVTDALKMTNEQYTRGLRSLVGMIN